MTREAIALAKPVGQGWVDPAEDLDTYCMLGLEVRREPEQGLVVEYAVAKVADLVERCGDVVALPGGLGALPEDQAKVLPEGELILAVEKGHPEAEGQLGDDFVRVLLFLSPGQLADRALHLSCLPGVCWILGPGRPPVGSAVLGGQAAMDAVSKRDLKDVEHRHHRFGQQDVMRVVRSCAGLVAIPGDAEAAKTCRREVPFQFVPVHEVRTS